jgi:gluconate 2-dehydrogenase gamma chain
MAGQSAKRREILRYIGIASVAGSFPGFAKWAFACSPGHIHEPVAASARAATNATKTYKPLFFSDRDFRMVERLTEMIIPADDTPGAKEAGVAEFIDFMVANRVPVRARHEIRSTADAIASGHEAQNRFLTGLAWLNARAKSEFASEFMGCSPDQQKNLLEELAYKAKFRPMTESGREFFLFLREYTVVGYYTTKIGLESIGYPGIRIAWPVMPTCPHPDDPEHLHLRQPASNHSGSSLPIHGDPRS